MAGAKGYTGQGRMDGVVERDPPEIRGKSLMCLPRERQQPVPGTSMPGVQGRGQKVSLWRFREAISVLAHI